MTNKIKNSLKLFIAIMKGDDAEVAGLKVISKAESIFTAELSQLDYKKHELVDNLEKAEEHATKALVNFGKPDVDRETYLAAIYSADNAITTAKEEIAEHERLVKLIKAKIKELQAVEV